ncbi:MAG: hypothetical protein ABL997_02545 [Planctomycetota bacterium]
MRALATLFVLAAALSAQTVTLPFPAPLASNTQLPFAAGIGRYQQWFSPAQAGNFGGQPIRVQSLTVLAGTLASITTTLDCEISMCHAPSFGLNSTFDTNYVGLRTIVRPRTILTLGTAGIGQPVLTVPFTEMFTWDGQSAFLVEVRVFGNGRSNQPFNADQRSTDAGFGIVSRVYAGGNASATSGQLTTAQGLFLRFSLRPGAKAHFGSGCRGINFITPTADTLQLPTPGGVWTHQLQNAAAQTLAGLAIGTSRTLWDSEGTPVALPLDLTNVLSAPGCFLLVEPEITLFPTTVGGPGTASATMALQVPPLSEFVGLSFFSQWVVFDPAAVNGVLSATDALWSIVTPIGG